MERRTVALAAATTASVVASYYLISRLKPLKLLIQLLDPIQPKRSLDSRAEQLISLDDIEEFIAEKPNTVIAGAEQKIVWNEGRTHERTRVAVVYIHGWSACRQEIAPIPQKIASALHANLYLGRLPGHGRRHERGRLGGGGPSGDTLLTEATPQELFLYACKALRIGQSLGDQVVLVGMSTGGSLVTWLAAKLVRENRSEVLAGMVLISPAYALAHPLYPALKSVFATLRAVMPPLRRRLIEIVVGGKERNIKALNAQHARYGSLNYPTAAILNLMDVLWEVEYYLQEDSSLLLDTPVIMIGNPQDPTINFRTVATNLFLQRWCDVPKVLYCVSRSEHPHVLGSQILSPSTVVEVSRAAIAFLETNTGALELHNGSKMKRAQSMTSGLGQYSSRSSFSELTRPLLSESG